MDEWMNAKLADVGIAVVVPHQQQQQNGVSGVGSLHAALATGGGGNHHQLPNNVGRSKPQSSAAARALMLSDSVTATGSSAVLRGIDIEGTDDYLDPLYSQLRQLSPASDVYALGLVMCQLVCCCEDPKVSLLGTPVKLTVKAT